MKKRRMMVMYAALFILTAALLFGLFLSDVRDNGVGITLPEKESTVIDPTPGIGKKNSDRIAEVTVDKNNAQRVIASMFRPKEYGCIARAVYYYSGGSKTMESRWWVKPGICRLKLYDANEKLKSQSILTEHNVYIWGPEGATYYQGRPGEFTPDEIGRIPSYEDIATLPPEEILSAELTEREETSCIYVRSGTAEKYTDWYVSLENGLLLYAEAVEENGPVYTVSLTALEVGAADNALFLLPNGSNPE